MKNILKISFYIFSILVSFKIVANTAYEDALKSFHQRNYEATIIHLKNALKEDIDHIPSRLLLVETFIGQGKGEIAETELYDLQARGVDFNQIIALLAQSLILQSKYEQVLDIATSGYRGNHIESLILFTRGQAYLGLQQLRQAEKAFQEALTIQSDFQLAMLGVAQVAMIQNNLVKASKYLDQALNSYEPLINAWIMKANLYQMQRLPDDALTTINKALKQDSEHLQARLTRATLYINNEKWQEASADLDLILTKIPQEPRAKYLLSIVSARLGNTENSKEKLREVIITLNSIPDEVMKQNPSYLFLAGVTNYNVNNFEDAYSYFQRFLSIKEFDFNSLRYLAIIELKQGKPQNAKNILTKANVYYPDNPALLSLLGISSMELGKIEQAKFYFEKVVSLTPGYSSALSNLAQSEILAGNYQQAISNLLDAKKSDTDSTAITLLLVEAYLKTQKYNEAKALTQKLVEAQPNNSYFHQQHGIALGFSGDITNAINAFKESIKLDPANSKSIIHLARIELIEKGPKLAITLLTEKLKKQPNNTNLIVELGDMYVQINNKDEALKQYLKAFDYNNQNSFTLTKLVDFYFNTEQFQKAEPVLLSYLQKNPKDSQIKEKLAYLYGKLNQPLKAIKTLESAIPDATDRTKTYMLLAQALLTIDNRAEAIKSLNKATAWDEERIEPLLMLFPIVLSNKDYVRAEQIIYTINKLIPEQDVVDILTAQLFEEKQDFIKAAKSYKIALTKANSRTSTLGLFNSLNKQKKYVESQQLIQQWIIKNPEDVLADIAFAESYVYQNKLTQALEQYLTLIDKYNRMPILLNNAANIALKLEDLTLAAKFAEEAYKKAPKISSIIDTLAWVKTQQSKRAEAISLFRQALVLDFDNAEIKYHLAVTLKAENRDREAYKLLTEAVKNEQDFPEKTVAQELLAKWKEDKSSK